MVAPSFISPTKQDTDLARESGKVLESYTRDKHSLTLHISDQDQPIELPAGAVTLLMDILQAMAAGQGVAVIPENAELTTVQAAEILKVSRPFLIKRLENGEIPYRMVGTHRRIRMVDVLAYKTEIDRQREQVLDELVAEAQRLDLGY